MRLKNFSDILMSDNDREEGSLPEFRTDGLRKVDVVMLHLRLSVSMAGMTLFLIIRP